MAILGQNPFRRYTSLVYRPDDEEENLPFPTASTQNMAGPVSVDANRRLPGADLNGELGIPDYTGRDLNIDLSIPQDTPLTDLKDTIRHMPMREDYKPSLGRKIGAALAGGAVGATQGGDKGFKVSQEITNLPFQRATEDWQRKFGGQSALYKLDSTERKENFDRGIKQGELGVKLISEATDRMNAETGAFNARTNRWNAIKPTDQDKLINLKSIDPNAYSQFMKDRYGHLSVAERKEIDDNVQAQITKRTQMEQAGANSRNAADNARITTENALNRELQKSLAKGDDARTQKIAYSLAAEKVRNMNSAYQDIISFNDKGNLIINTDDPKVREIIVKEIGNEMRSILSHSKKQTFEFLDDEN